MKASFISYASVLLAAAVMLQACGGGPANQVGTSNVAGSSNSNSAKTNVEELTMQVNVPYALDDLVWKDYPAQKRVVAVMRVSAEDVGRIIADSSGYGQAENVSIPSQTWFPDELIAQAEMSGDNSLKGLAYPANAFFQEPYNSGRIARVEGTDFFILDLNAK